MDERPWHRSYDEGVRTSIDYEETPIPAFLERTVSRAPDRLAVVFKNARLTYRQLKGEVDRLATAMARLGVEPGSSVAIHLPNVPQAVIAYQAALRAGAKVVLTNPLYTEREIEHQWNDAGCSLAVTADFLYASRVRDLRASLPVRHVIVASIPEYLRFPLGLLARWALARKDPPLYARFETSDTVHRFRELVDATPAEPPDVETGMEDVAVLQYTGGTTGVPKAAMLTHRNLSVNVQQSAAWFADFRFGQEVVLTALPLFHVFGMTVCMNFGIHLGMTLVLAPNPRDVDDVLRSVVRHGVTFFPGVPALFNALNHHRRVEHVDLSSVKACISGSAPIPPEVLQRFEKLTGARVTEGYGLSETSPVTHVNPMHRTRKIGSIGIPVADTDARIIDAEEGRRVLSVGEEGELCLRGPQVMKGYWKMPEETAQVLHGGWFHTGDLAAMDEDGYFRIVGRKKDMINASGFKVYPDEVDAVLVSHEDVVEAATIGVPHETRGETVKSFIVKRPGCSLDAGEIERHCREHLAAYKVPREVEFLDELPKSTVLKVLRRELREREAARRGDGSREAAG